MSQLHLGEIIIDVEQKNIKNIVVHEMVHLLVRKHNAVFRAYMNEYLPKWRCCKDELNR
jgi:hypothetical protein